jgi:SAM-dependent methyltransferase
VSTEPKSSPAEMYEAFLGPAIFHPWAGALLEQALPAPGEHVLDLACGTGIVARQVAPVVRPGGRVVGLDISPDMLRVAGLRAAEQALEVDWREGDAGDHDLPDSSFDLLLCQQGLQFFPNRPGATRHMRRVLRDGGRAVVSVWKGLDHHDTFRAICEAEARVLDVPLEDVARPFLMDDAGELESLFREAGFGNVNLSTRQKEVVFPSADEFVRNITLAAAAVMPELEQIDSAELVDAVKSESAPVLERYRRGDALAFPMTSHVVHAA